VYEQIPVQESISQGDVIEACPIFALEASGAEIDLNAPASRWEERVVVLTQSCDLAQNKVTRVLVAVVRSAQELVAQGVLKASAIRDHVRRGLVYGWYFLPVAPEPVALPECLVNLHDLHTVSRAVLERLIANGKRVCRIVTPYREHLAQHFAVTYMRIGLPEPYATEP
jgi:hypothetical protein